MRKVNKILMLFVLGVVAASYLFWQILHSEQLADFLSQRINSLIKSEISTEIAFQNFEFELFPPGILLRNVTIAETHEKTTDVVGSMRLSQLGIYFGILDFAENKISIKNIKLNDGVVVLRRVFASREAGASGIPKPRKRLLDLIKDPSESVNNANFQMPKVQDVKNIIREITNVSIKGVSIANVRLIADGSEIYVKKLTLYEQRNSLVISSEFRQLPSSWIPEKYSYFDLDSVAFKVEMFDDKLRLHYAEIFSEQEKVKLSGMALKPKGKETEWSYDMRVSLIGELDQLLSMALHEWPIKIEKGVIQVELSCKGRGKDIAIEGEVKLRDFETEYLDAHSLNLNFSFIGSKLQIHKLQIQDVKDDGKGRGIIDQQFVLYDFSEGKWLPEGFQLALRRYPLSSAFKVLQEYLYSMKGYFDGDILVNIVNDHLFFLPQEGLAIQEFKLHFDPEDPVILKNDELVFHSGSFELDNTDLYIGADVSLGENRLSVVGKVTDDLLEFEVKDGLLDFKDFGDIAGVKILGAGKGSIEVKEIEGVFFLTIEGIFKDFEIMDFRLGDVETTIKIDLENIRIEIAQLLGRYGNANYKGQGMIDVQEYPNLDVKIDFSNGNIRDIRKMLAPFSKDLEFIPLDISGKFIPKVQIKGGFDINKLQIDGTFSGESVSLYSEMLSSVTGRFRYFEKQLEIDPIVVKKGAGRGAGKLLVGIDSGEFDYNARIQGVQLKDINIYQTLPLGIRGIVKGEFSGKNDKSGFQSSSNLLLQGSSINGRSVSDSRISVESLKERLEFSMQYLGEKIIADGILDFSQKESDESKNSKIDVQVKIDQLPVLLASFFGQYMRKSDFDGNAILNGSSHFNMNRLSDLDLDIEIDEFKFRHNEIDLSLSEEWNGIKVVDGQIGAWEILMKGNGLSFKSTGKGSFTSQYGLQTFLYFDSSLLEIIIPQIRESRGLIGMKILASNKTGKNDIFWEVKSDDLFFDHNKSMGKMENIKLVLTGNEKELRLEKFTADFATGKLDLYGIAKYFNRNIEVDLNYVLDRCNINVTESIQALFGGRGRLHGKSLPYTLSGSLVVAEAAIGSEIDELGDKSTNVEFKYLPPNQGKSRDILLYDISLVTSGDIQVQNSLSDVFIQGDFKIAGSNNSPRFGGRLRMIPSKSRFFFKGNEFQLKKGGVLFFENEKNVNPELDILAGSSISGYEVSMRVYGRAKSLKVDLSSKPSLSQTDILSLLALGYPATVSKELGESDRESLTSVGVGSIVLDQLKINKGLKSALGVKIQISSEFSEDEKKLLGSRIGSEGAQSGSMRSATKIELKKKISKKMDLSVSSTVGGTAANKQEMNLNYNFNKNVAAEGVYEVKSTDGEEDTTDDTSAGADLKFKWSW